MPLQLLDWCILICCIQPPAPTRRDLRRIAKRWTSKGRPPFQGGLFYLLCREGPIILQRQRPNCRVGDKQSRWRLLPLSDDLRRFSQSRGGSHGRSVPLGHRLPAEGGRVSFYRRRDDRATA